MENPDPVTPGYIASRSDSLTAAPGNTDVHPQAPDLQAYHGLSKGSMARTRAQELPEEGSAAYQLTPTTQPSELTSKDLSAPVSAMHNISHSNPAQDITKTPTDTYYSFEQQQPAPHLGLFFGHNIRHDDIITRGLIDQTQARQLFNSFMTNATNFLPIFDPILDSFETLRTREPFCFAVVLFLASCMEVSSSTSACVQDVRDLMSRSLFQYPASLGKIQAMILLVAYAESTWYALGHALQMALDLGMDKALSNDQMPSQTSHFSPSKNQRRNIHRARVWLALCFIEREIAMGMAKTSRMPQVSSRDLSQLTCQSHVHPSNMRLASLVEAVQVRNEFLQDITLATDLESSALVRLQHMNTRFDEWFQHWDALHKDCGYDVSSFQRTSLQGQRSYAMMFLGCATIGRVSGNQPLSTAISTSASLTEVVKYVLPMAMDQLHRVVESDSYRWHLRWATYYTTLSLAFAGKLSLLTCERRLLTVLSAIFALEMCKHEYETEKQQEVSTVVTAVAQILKNHHDPFFFRLIQARLAQHVGTSPIDFGFEQYPQQQQTVSLYENEATSGTNAIGVISDNMMGESRVMDIGRTAAPGTLDQFLDTADWMTNPSSMMVFDTEKW